MGAALAVRAPVRGFVLVLGLVVGAPLAAQEPPGRDTGRLGGTVVDAVADVPLARALVVLEDERRAVLTDSLGVFDLGEVPSGEVLLTVRHYGYDALEVFAVVPSGSELRVELELDPRAVLVDGITVVADRLALMEQRLRVRRLAVPASTDAFGQERLVGSGARDLLEFVRLEGSLPTTACARGSWSGLCVLRRGRPVEPRVFIDEVPLIGGLDYLVTYRPYDLYLLEVYSRGLEIRAYTHHFMERMAVKPMALIPIGLWP